MDKKIFNPSWKNVWKIWSKTEPPMRPSKRDIRFWEKKIIKIKEKKPNLKALVLGCTPEIRDMLARQKVSTFCLDVHRSMYLVMGQLTKHKNKKEEFIQGNWLEADKIFQKNSFDLVCGDTPHCNLSFKDWPRFFKIIANVLRPKGYLLLSTEIMLDFEHKLTIEEVLKKYKKQPEYFKDYKNRHWALFRLQGETEVYDKKRRGFIMDNLKNTIIKNALKAGLSQNEIYRYLWFFKEDKNGELTGGYIETDPPLKEQLAIQSEYFKLEEIFRDKSHPVFNIRRVMILKSKKL